MNDPLMNSQSVDHIYGELPEMWRYTTIGELMREGKAHLQTGPFGTNLLASEYTSSGVPVIAVKNIGTNQLVLDDDTPRVGKETFQRLQGYKVIHGDILFGRKGAVDRRAYVTQNEAGWLQGSDCIRLRFLSSDIDSKYVSYVLGTPQYLSWITRNAGGSTMPSLNQNILSRIPLPLPLTEVQHEIARVLGALDDKINLNRRMNATLEATARTLFQSWFVDFDPVRAKAEGRQPEGMESETAALFPDSFEESELGLIPSGWAVQPLSEHVRAAKGLSYKGSGLADNGEGMPMHNLNSVYEGGGYKYEGIKHYTGDYQARHIAIAGDLIVTNTEQGHDMLLIGYPALIPNHYPEGLFSHHLYRVTPLEESYITSRFLYFLMRTDFFHEVIGGYTNGTTVNMLPVEGLQRPLFVVPPPELVARFDQLVAPMLAKMEVNHDESETLAETRDALLPKLISGQLRVGTE